MSKSLEIAKDIKETADRLGWTIEIRDTILIIRKEISSAIESYTMADSEYYSILSKMPTTSPGSIWGTTGDTVGALAAMKSGIYEVKKSGCSKNVIKAISKRYG